MTRRPNLGWLSGVGEYLYLAVAVVISAVLTALLIVGVVAPPQWLVTLIVALGFMVAVLVRERQHHEQLGALQQKVTALETVPRMPEIEIVSPLVMEPDIKGWLKCTGDGYRLGSTPKITFDLAFDLIHRGASPAQVSFSLQGLNTDWPLGRYYVPDRSTMRAHKLGVTQEPFPSYLTVLDANSVTEVSAKVCLVFAIPAQERSLQLLKGLTRLDATIDICVGPRSYPCILDVDPPMIRWRMMFYLAELVTKGLDWSNKSLDKTWAVMRIFDVVAAIIESKAHEVKINR